jgi:hypothetical protein
MLYCEKEVIGQQAVQRERGNWTAGCTADYHHSPNADAVKLTATQARVEMEGLLFVSAFLNASSPYQVTTD